MQTEPAFTETELARRWNVSIKTLQRWRSEERGPPYIKLSKAIRYPVDEIVTYEQAIRQGMAHEVPLPSLNEAQPVVESPAPAAPEPKRYGCLPFGPIENSRKFARNQGVIISFPANLHPLKMRN